MGTGDKQVQQAGQPNASYMCTTAAQLLLCTRPRDYQPIKLYEINNDVTKQQHCICCSTTVQDCSDTSMPPSVCHLAQKRLQGQWCNLLMRER